MAQTALDAVQGKFGDAVSVHSHAGDEVIETTTDKLLEVAEYLRSDDKLAFDSPVFVTCTDRLGLMKSDDDHRYEVVYQLRSSVHKHRVRIKVPVSEDTLECPALSTMYPGFLWQERETYDMYGIQFKGNDDLRRIYMYEEFVGHPLRKDYPKDKRQPLVRRDWD